MRNESRGTTLVLRTPSLFGGADSTWSGAVRNGGPEHSETITAPNRLGLGLSFHSLMEHESGTAFSRGAQGRVRGRAVAEASSTWPHSLSLAARYYSLSLPFIGIRLHPKVARTFESRQGIVDSADTFHVPIVLVLSLLEYNNWTDSDSSPLPSWERARVRVFCNMRTMLPMYLSVRTSRVSMRRPHG